MLFVGIKLISSRVFCRAPLASKVSLKAREILISCALPSYEERMLQMEKILHSSVTTSYYGESGDGHRSVLLFVSTRIGDLADVD